MDVGQDVGRRDRKLNKFVNSAKRLVPRMAEGVSAILSFSSVSHHPKYPYFYRV